jgi:hypothetical protein
MRDSKGKKTLAAVVMSIAVLENAGLIWCATGGIIADRQSGTDMPFGTVFGFLLYLAIGISMVFAWMFFHRSGRVLVEVHERLLWTGVAMAIAPWTAVFSLLQAFWFGSAGWLLALFLGTTAPYVLIAATLRMQSVRR